MTRLHDDDTAKRLVEVLSDGNLEAAAALLTLLENSYQQSASKGMVLLGITRFFDEWGMYGKDVAVVLNDLCEGDPLKFIMLFSSIVVLYLTYRFIFHSNPWVISYINY